MTTSTTVALQNRHVPEKQVSHAKWTQEGHGINVEQAALSD
jgi:hypothetical protein